VAETTNGPDGPEEADMVARVERLSAGQLDCLRLVNQHLSSKEIAAELDISPHTVVAHVKKIYRKLAVHSRGEAVYEASQMGLL